MKEKFEQKSSYSYDELVTFAHSGCPSSNDLRHIGLI